MSNKKSFAARLRGFFAALVRERAAAAPRLKDALDHSNR